MIMNNNININSRDYISIKKCGGRRYECLCIRTKGLGITAVVDM
jgi:hypothetical protein